MQLYKSLRSKWWILAALLITAVGIALLLATTISSSYLSGKDFATMRETTCIGHLYGANHVAQRFESHHNGLARIDIALRSQPNGKVMAKLEDADAPSSIVWTTEITPTSNTLTYYAITFPPLESLGRVYTLTISAVGQPFDQRASVEVTTVDVYPNNRMYLNEQPTTADIAYRVYYRPSSAQEWVELTLGEVSYAETLLKRTSQYKPALYKGVFIPTLGFLLALTLLTFVSLVIEQSLGLPQASIKVHLTHAAWLTVAILISLIGLTTWTMRPPQATPVETQSVSTLGKEGTASQGKVIYDFVLALERGEVEFNRPWLQARRTWVVPSMHSLNGDWRPSIQMRLSSEASSSASTDASFSVRLPHNAALQFSTALPSYDKTNSAVCMVKVNHEVVFEQPVEPGETPSSYDWRENTVDLSDWGGRQVDITLVARPLGEGEQGFVLWGLPAIVVYESEQE